MYKLLPIGSIIKIKKIKQPIMIIAFLQQVGDQLYEYMGVPYPTGMTSEKSTIVFNSNVIEGLIAEGYRDSDANALLEAIPNILSGLASISAEE